MLEKPHLFYQWSVKKQLAFMISIGVFLAVLTGFGIYSSLVLAQGWLAIFAPFILITLASFIDMPMGKKSGRFTYYAPLFILENRKGNMVMHGGTLFDYFFVFDWKDRGMKARYQSMHDMLDGCLALAKQYNSNEEIHFTGTSYFFHEKTAKKLGFEVMKPSFNDLFILYLNYFSLMLMFSFTNKRLSFPSLSKTVCVRISNHQILANQAKFEQLRDLMARRLNAPITLHKSL